MCVLLFPCVGVRRRWRASVYTFFYPLHVQVRVLPGAAAVW